MATTEPNRRRIFASVFPPVQLDGPKPKTKSRDPEQATWDRAWLAATKFLSIPDQGFRGIENYVPKAPGREVNDALAYLAADKGVMDREEWSIFEWYGSDMRRHFYRNFKVALVKVGISLYVCGLVILLRGCVVCSFWTSRMGYGKSFIACS